MSEHILYQDTFMWNVGFKSLAFKAASHNEILCHITITYYVTSSLHTMSHHHYQSYWNVGFKSLAFKAASPNENSHTSHHHTQTSHHHKAASPNENSHTSHHHTQTSHHHKAASPNENLESTRPIWYIVFAPTGGPSIGTGEKKKEQKKEKTKQM